MTEQSALMMTALGDRGADQTITEITQQPALWRQVGRFATALRAEDADLVGLLSRPGLRVLLTGAGTSAFAGEIVAPVLRCELGRRVDAVPSTDLVSNPEDSFAEDVPTLLVSFARSGDSPESVAAARLADQCLSECHHLVLTCNPHGHLAREYADRPRSRVLLMPAAADDRGFAMTSSFTCMMLAALLVLGGVQQSLVERLAAVAEQTLLEQTAASGKLAAAGYNRIVYLGSGALKGLARESALKVLELTAGRVTAMSDSSLGFRHGPKAALDADTLVVVYLSNDPYTRRYDLDILTELRASQGVEHVVAVAADIDDVAGDGPIWRLPGLGDVADAALALPAVIGAQLLALQFSLAADVASDNPFPSGEVNRVVQGVTIYPFQV